jgi:hypothetical protein
MNVDQIRTAIRAQPFRPFRIRTADGREHPVSHPEFLMIVPSGRTVILANTEDSVELIDTLLISSIHYDQNGEPKGRSTSAGSSEQ